jgi:hypothetical protein
LDGVVTPYSSALSRYQFELAAIHWPASLSVDSTALVSQVTALNALAQNVASVGPGQLGAWLTQFHSESQSTLTANATLRHDLGLPSTT